MNFYKNYIDKHNQAQQVTKMITFITGRCGSGKTQTMLDTLVNPIGITIWASPTRKLSRETYISYKNKCDKLGVPCYGALINSDISPSVPKDIFKIADKNKNAVIFITHKTLLNPANELVVSKARVIVDEIPTTAVTTLTCNHGSSTQQHILQFCELSPNKVGSSDYFYLRLKSELQTRLAVQCIVDEHNSGASNTYNPSVIKMFELLLADYDIAYYTCGSKTDGDYVTHKMKAIVREELDYLLRISPEMTILGANLMGSLFGKALSLTPNIQFNETNVVGSTTLEIKHKQAIRIVPYLIDGNWSAGLKEKPVEEGLINRTGSMTVFEDAQRFTHEVLGSDYLIGKNINDSLSMDAMELSINGIQVLTSHVHGINNLRHYDKASVLFACNPLPDEEHLLRVFAESYDCLVGSDELIESLRTERYLESAYQFIARTGVRLPASETVWRQFTIVVPDMRCANYIAERFENPIIDTLLGFTTATAYNAIKIKEDKIERDAKKKQAKVKLKADKAQAKLEKKLNLCRVVLMEKRLTGANMADIFRKFNTSKATFERAKKECREQLIAEGFEKEMTQK